MNKNCNMTKNYIFQAFYLLLTKQKYDKISVCDICDKAGVSRMSFYRNFESKDDLLIKGLDFILGKFKEKIDSMENKNHYGVIKELFEIFKKYKDIYPALEGTSISKTLLINAIERIKKDAIYDNITRTSKYIPTFYFSAISVTMFDWLRNGAVESADEMARLITSLIKLPE